MDIDIFKVLLSSFEGCTFATLDARTAPKPGVVCTIVGERVILFTNKRSSGYDNMVRRRLEASGKNPDDFILSDLPWGERVPNTPLIEHKGKFYLQTILLASGQHEYTVCGTPVNPLDFGIKRSHPNQGLAPSDAVIVHTYALENIERISLMGDNISTSEKPKRAILHLKH